MRFEVFAGVLLRFQVLWEVMPCCLGLVPFADAGTMNLQNLGNRSPSDMASHHRRRESLRLKLTKIMERPTVFGFLPNGHNLYYSNSSFIVVYIRLICIFYFFKLLNKEIIKVSSDLHCFIFIVDNISLQCNHIVM